MKPRLQLFLATALLAVAVLPVAAFVGSREAGADVTIVRAAPIGSLTRSIAGGVYLPHQVVVLDEVVVAVEPVPGALVPPPAEVRQFQVCTQWRPIALDTAEHTTRSLHARVCDVRSSADPAEAGGDAPAQHLRAPQSTVEFESSPVAPMAL